jgi:hypothetical protein
MGDEKKIADCSSNNGVVIQRVIREVGGGSSYPTLTKNNYSDWALLMEVKLKARALWNVVEHGGADPQEEMMALDALCSAVPSEMVSSIADKEMAKEAWKTISYLRVGDDRMKKSAAVQLRRKFDMATFNDGKSVEDFALRLNGMAAELATLGARMEEGKIVEKIAGSVPQRLKQNVLSITTLLDMSTLTVSDMVGRLRAAEDAFEEAPRSLQHDGRLYLTEEEWDARRKKREVENHSGGSSSGGTGRRGGGRKGRGRGRGGRSSSGPSSGKPTGDECRRCGKMGHWVRECPSKPKKEHAHVVQEDEEATLLLVRASPTLFPPPPQSSRTPATATRAAAPSAAPSAGPATSSLAAPPAADPLHGGGSSPEAGGCSLGGGSTPACRLAPPKAGAGTWRGRT